MSSSAPNTKPPRKRARRPAAKGSLIDLMHQHAGLSLFVRPICWTDMHTQLLGVRFHKLPACSEPVPPNIPGSPPSRGHMRPSKTIITLSEALTDLCLPGNTRPLFSSRGVQTILRTLWPQAFSRSQLLPEMHLFFGDHVYRDVIRAQIMWDYPSTTPCSSYPSFQSVSTRPAGSFNLSQGASSLTSTSLEHLPMLCYLGKEQLASARNSLFRVASGPASSNEPVRRLQQLRSKMLMPSDSDEDPHLVAMFLAMAQRHFYAAPPPSSRRNSQWSPGNKRPPCPNFRDVKLKILTHEKETADFIVYTGYVSAKFLERFHDPRKVPAGEEGPESLGIKIEYTRVPIWPILGLRERLGKAMGEEIVGAFDPDQIETWEEDGETRVGEKRSRAALAEVFNNSFEEESDEEGVLHGKRRCLGHGNAVGLVN
ncbi:hypothetical protein S40285_01738 [Stachybotrys chlorohalonatus IBT 40285]|uniref:Uncharacterized protein n=1 Tax=Stachybotrys chlorohalonatus (strain IBT 40285) TaxID=1283841 RepID=A0A084R294_STAC4|nr:hypothetical protein S40285_01738 [Stachybotrys chlorohalonata IBT 40285]